MANILLISCDTYAGREFVYFDPNFNKAYCEGPIDIKSVLVQIMA